VLALLSVWGEVQICIWPSWCHCHSLSLAPVNPEWFCFSVAGLPGLSWKKRPLNECSVVVGVWDYLDEPVPESKTNLDFTESRDNERQWHQLGHMQICTSPQTDNHTSTLPLSFLQARCPSCCPTNSVKALKAQSYSRKLQEIVTVDEAGQVTALSLGYNSNRQFVVFCTFIQIPQDFCA